MSEATRSRWQWTWVGDDSVFKKYGEQLGLVGTWWSGQEHRVLSGIDGVLLVVVIGEGKLIVPVDFAIRRPDPTVAGAPCRDMGGAEVPRRRRTMEAGQGTPYQVPRLGTLGTLHLTMPPWPRVGRPGLASPPPSNNAM
jgi:hypothetical protein